MNRLYAEMGPTIFTTMSALAAELGAVNLGQAFPELDGPRDIRERAAQALLEGPNQYPPSPGLPELRQAVAEHYRAHQGLALDWKTEITITSGATEALADALLAVIEPGDEVVLIEPMYDSYLPMVRRAGGAPRFVRLAPPHWTLDREALARAFGPKTAAIIINTPVNPCASMLSADDLAFIARIAAKHDAVIISDEVWEHVVFDGRAHDGMLNYARDRTIKIGSAGKMFSMTGWKVGFACAPPPLSEALAKAHQFNTFTTAPNLQKAVAYGLGKPTAYFQEMRAAFQRGRDRLARGLEQAGYKVLPAAGAYFLSVDLPASGIDVSDEAFSLRCVKEAGVAVIPYAPFYATGDPPPLVRLCFAKTDDTLDRGIEAMAKARALFA
jgi:aspartate/methionine/tyrosine aminotransferase